MGLNFATAVAFLLLPGGSVEYLNHKVGLVFEGKEQQAEDSTKISQMVDLLKL